MSFQDWVTTQINGLRDAIKKIADDSRSIPELEDKQDIAEEDYIPVYDGQQKKTKKFQLSKFDPLNAEYQKVDELDQPNGYVGLNNDSKIRKEFIPKTNN